MAFSNGLTGAWTTKEHYSRILNGHNDVLTNVRVDATKVYDSTGEFRRAPSRWSRASTGTDTRITASSPGAGTCLCDYVEVTDFYPPTRRDSLTAALLDGGADLLPVFGPSLKTLYLDSAKRQAAATGEVFRRLAKDVGEELFTRAIEEDPRLRSLLLNAIDLCYRTSFEAKRWRYAEALRDGILDPTKINKAIVDFQVLRDVEVPHIQVLDELASGLALKSFYG